MITVRTSIPKSGRLLVALVAGAALFTAAPAAHADTTPSDQCSAAFDNGDARLGPAELPSTGPVGRQLFGYQRTGGVSESAFVAQYYDSAAGGWSTRRTTAF